MKIRTRLLLSLLPALIGGIILIAILLCYSWRSEISNGFKERLQLSLTTTATLIKTNANISDDLHQFWDPFGSYQLIITEANGRIHTILSTPDMIDVPKAEKNNQRLHASVALSDQSTLTAEVKTSTIDQIFLEHIRLAVLGVALLAIIATISLYFIAGKISVPVQKLNNSALAIAAGRYGESIQVTGPKELKELANTLNTMSECLLENINRQKENSQLRERMYGEAECVRLLQLQMLQKNIDECASDAIAVKSISFASTTTRGFLIDFPVMERLEILNIHLAEAKLTGFEGMYQLLTQYKLSKDQRLAKLPFLSLRLTLDREQSTISSRSAGCALPYIWSINNSELTPLKGICPIAAGDFIFLMNHGFLSFFKEPLRITDLITKVLKYFAQDGLETSAAMLNKEIAFAIKRKDLQEDLHLLCIQILKPTID